MSYVLSNIPILASNPNNSETYIKYIDLTNYFTKSNKNYKNIKNIKSLKNIKYNKKLLVVDLINIYTLIRSVLLLIFIGSPQLLFVLFRRIICLIILTIKRFNDKTVPCALKRHK